jgi:hypothetical protein
MNIEIKEKQLLPYRPFNDISYRYNQWFYYSKCGKEDHGLCYVTEKGVFSVDVLGISLINDRTWQDFKFRSFNGEITIKVN